MIEFLVNFNISIMSLIILAIILVITRVKRDHFSFSSYLLRALILITITGTLLESSSWYFEQIPGNFAYELAFITNSLALLCGTVVSSIWLSYWDYAFLSSKKRIIQRKYYLLPVAIQFLLLVYNRLTKSFFYIDEVTNAFIQKPLYFILYFIYLTYFVYLVILIIRNRNKISKKVKYAGIIFMAFPSLSIIVQLLIPELIVSWPSLTISLLLVYLFLETTTGNIDELTKLYSRRVLELHLKSIIEDKKPFSAMMIDVDRFKYINDVFGHTVGDEVLIHFAGILNACVDEENTFIARLGGDEFFIINRHAKVDETTKLIQDIKQMVDDDPFLAKFTFFDFSVGFIHYDQAMSIDDILNHADRQMYEQKRMNRLNYDNQINNIK